jgi:hypothetical protein
VGVFKGEIANYSIVPDEQIDGAKIKALAALEIGGSNGMINVCRT